jgi:hypothetical protein
VEDDDDVVVEEELEPKFSSLEPYSFKVGVGGSEKKGC